MLWKVDSIVHFVHFLRINSRRESKMNVFVLKLKLKKATKRVLFSWGFDGGWNGGGMWLDGGLMEVRVDELVVEYVERCKTQTQFTM